MNLLRDAIIDIFCFLVAYQVVFTVKLTSLRNVSVHMSFNLAILAHGEGRRKNKEGCGPKDFSKVYRHLLNSVFLLLNDRLIRRGKIQRFDVDVGWLRCVNVPKLDLSWLDVGAGSTNQFPHHRKFSVWFCVKVLKIP